MFLYITSPPNIKWLSLPLQKLILGLLLYNLRILGGLQLHALRVKTVWYKFQM